MPSAASKRNPDSNWHTQHEQLLFHIIRSTDTDQTSGLVSTVAQKNNQSPDFILFLSTLPFSMSTLASLSITTTSRGKRGTVSFCASLLWGKFPYKFSSRLSLHFHWHKWHSFKEKGRRTCYFVKSSLDHPYKKAATSHHCLPAFPSNTTKALFSFLAFIAMFCFAICTFLSTKL